MTGKKRVTRRQMLAATGAVASLPSICTSWASAQTPPSEQIVLGCIGVGGQGTGLLASFHANPRCRIAAVCDVFKPHLNRAQQHVGDADAYGDFRRVLDRDDIDAVVIAAPDHWHALMTVMACQAGKDVYCEKPLSRSVAEGRTMVDVTRRYKRVVQMGTQHRSNPAIRQVCEWVRNGRLGKVEKVRLWVWKNRQHKFEPNVAAPPDLDWDMWLGPSPWVPYNPLRCPWNFRWFMQYAGGYMTDWGAHMISVISWAMGTDETGPVAVEGTGTRDYESFWDVPVDMNLTYRFESPSPFEMTWEQPGDGGHGGPEFGMQFIGHNATITEFFGRHTVDRGEPDLSPTRPDEIHLYASNNHHVNWLDCIVSRKRPIVDVEIGHRMTCWCHLGNIAYTLGRKVHWDPVAEHFLDDDAANRQLHYAYRQPWHL